MLDWLMHDFHYNFIKKHFNAKLLFTDADSLTYDVYEEFFSHKHLLDFSNYPNDSKFVDETNKKVNGKKKDGSEVKIIGEFVRLRSKMYSIKNIDGKESNTAKGVSKVYIFNSLRLRSYF